MSLATVNCSGGPRVGKYTVHVEEFQQTALECLRYALSRLIRMIVMRYRQASTSDVIVMDELGKMESMASEFCRAVQEFIVDGKARKQARV